MTEKMLFLIITMCVLVTLCSGQGNFTMDIVSVEKPWTCRTERRIYLEFDQYARDTCARCYNYMPRSYFTNKFFYLSEMGALLDLETNVTHEATPVNTSTYIMASFVDEMHVWKWKGCCLAAAQCCHRMLHIPRMQADEPYCPRTWDGWRCWDDTSGGTTATDTCPGHIYFDNDPPSCPKYVSKVCWPNGTWFESAHGREWTNYSTCARIDEHRNYFYFHIATYSVSIVSLVPALIIFSMYKQLQVHRISMHKNLFMSLFLNGIVAVLFKSIVIVDELNKTKTYQTVMDRNGAACKILFILTRYFRMTNYMWMFCEGFYLHKLIAAAFAEQKNLLMFYIIGWVVPVFPVGIYAILRKLTADEKCWALPVEMYEWIINAPSMTSLLVNLIFLCNIIRVLVTKLRATHSNEPSQYRKAVRATLVLVPLFGVHFCLIIYRPPQTTACGLLQAYTYFSHAMDGLQGLLVSLIFCYMNGEVLYLLRRTYQRILLRRNLSSGKQSSMMLNPMSVTQVSSVVDTQTSHIHTVQYRTKDGDMNPEIASTLSDGNSVVVNVTVV